MERRGVDRRGDNEVKKGRLKFFNWMVIQATQRARQMMQPMV